MNYLLGVLPAALLAGCGQAVATSTASTSGSTATTSTTSESTSSDASAGLTSTESSSSADTGSTGWTPSDCDASCQLPALEHRWTTTGADVLGPPGDSGRALYGASRAPDGSVWLTTFDIQSQTNVAVVIGPDGSASTPTEAELHIPTGMVLGSTVFGESEYAALYSGERPIIGGLSMFEADGQFRCSQETPDLGWNRGVQVASQRWALLGRSVTAPSSRAVFFGDPCEASAQALVPADDVIEVLDFAYLDEQFVLTGLSAETSFVRAFDSAGAPTFEWSTEDAALHGVQWAAPSPDGGVALTNSLDDGFGGIALVLGDVNLGNPTADVREFHGLWNAVDPPRVSIDFDTADVPWLMFGDHDVRIAPLPPDDTAPCCPTQSEEWLAGGVQGTWAFFAMPDGMIAVGVTAPEPSAPTEVIVSRFGFTR